VPSAFLSAAITVPASYDAAPNVDLSDPKPDTASTADNRVAFVPDYFIFRAITGNFFYSFDGKNDHGMVFAADTVPLKIPCKARKVWVKQNGGASSARVQAFTTS
jgi:hypothetical protein